MAFSKGFVLLALVSCALAMPLAPIDVVPSDRKSTSGSNIAVADDKTPRNLEPSFVGSDRNADEQHEAVSDKTTSKAQQQIELVAHEIAERSAADEASESEDLDTAAGTNVLRPLFVYRQQVAYRQRIKDSRRRGSDSVRF